MLRNENEIIQYRYTVYNEMRTIGTLLVVAVVVGSATLWAADGVLPGGG